MEGKIKGPLPRVKDTLGLRTRFSLKVPPLVFLAGVRLLSVLVNMYMYFPCMYVKYPDNLLLLRRHPPIVPSIRGRACRRVVS